MKTFAFNFDLYNHQQSLYMPLEGTSGLFIRFMMSSRSEQPSAKD